MAFALVLSKDSGQMSNRLLANLLTLTTVMQAYTILEDLHAFNNDPYLFFIKAHVFFLLGPLFYFYVRSLIDKELKLSAKYLLHLLPFVVFFLVVLPLYLGSRETFQEIVTQKAQHSMAMSSGADVSEGDQGSP